MVKNLPANAGDASDQDLIPTSRRSPGVGNGNPLSILAWEIPWAEEPGHRVTKSRTFLSMNALQRDRLTLLELGTNWSYERPLRMELICT